MPILAKPAPPPTGGFLPAGAGQFFRHRTLELLGVAVLLFGMAALLALLTYHATDPSWNRATGGPTRNLLGWPGAYAADLALQALGFGAYLAPLAMIAWGVLLLRAKALHFFGLRLALLLAAMLLLAAACSGLGDVGRLVAHAGPGGVVGAALNLQLRELTLTHSSGGLLPWLDLIAGLAAAGAMVPVMGMRRGHLPLLIRAALLPFATLRWLWRAGLGVWRGRAETAPEPAGEAPAPPTGYAEIPGEIDASQYDPARFRARLDEGRPLPPRDARLLDGPYAPGWRTAGGESDAAAPPPADEDLELPRPGTLPPRDETRAGGDVVAFPARLDDVPSDRVLHDRIKGLRIEPVLRRAAPGEAAAGSPDGTFDRALPLAAAFETQAGKPADDDNPFAPPELPGDEPDGPSPAAMANVVALDAARRAEPAPSAPPEEPEAAAPKIVVKKPAAAAQSRRASKAAQPSFDFDTGEYALPPLDILQQPKPSLVAPRIDEEALTQNARLLETVLEDFGVKGQIVKVRPGPVVTLYELEPAPGTKSSRVIGLADDIARSMSAVSVRVATVPGRNVIGIELPNVRRETVYLRELLSTRQYEDPRLSLPLVLGKDIGGEPVIADLAKMPHLLIGGTTGSGKSVAINTMILSLLYRLPPDKCRFIMIDPKMLELSVYADIPHLLTPVVTEPRKAIVALKWTVREMEDRYRLMSQLGVRNIAGYNERVREAAAAGETLTRQVQIGTDPETRKPLFEEEAIALDELPFIVVIIDEMADLMLVAGKDIEAAVQRLAQMARAAGIHVVMATQRPSVDVITGTIKANFPTRVSFQVTSKIDSRTILGEQGGEQLLGQGDMLYMAGGGRIARVHGPFVSDGEVEKAVRHLRKQARPAYVESVTADSGGDGPAGGAPGEGGEEVESDELYDRAVEIVCRERKASTSFVQRHLQIGYNRAARIVERMEAEGVVGPANHVGKREVLAPKGDYAA